MKSFKIGIAGISVLALLSTPSRAASSPLLTHGEDACTSSESWSFSGAIPEAKRDDFKSSLKGRMAPVQGFSEALAMRRFAQTPENKFLGEYWISRSLFDAKLLHIAFGGFVNIASRPVKPETAGIQISAIECLLQIQAKYPAVAIPDSVAAQIPALRSQATTPQMQDIVWQAAGTAIRAQIPLKAAARKAVHDEKVDALLEALRGAGPYEDFALALRSSHENDHNSAVQHLEKYFATPNFPNSLKRFTNTAHVLFARELYSLQQFDRAQAELKHVTKSSNELSTALEELAWSFLMNDQLSEAIGTVTNLQVGGLRHTYAPEGPMVMAMALNELCQYPESVRAIRSFKKNYEKAFEWLQTGVSDKLYPLAVKYVRKTPGLTVPDQIASEWVRSPLFISNQDELNLLFDERDSTVGLGKSGAKEQTKIADALMLKAKDLPQRLKTAKAKMHDGDHLPSLLMADMLALKEMILHYRRLQQGAPVWHTILANYRKSVPTTESRLVGAINRDLKERSQRMLSQLEEIAENVQLIEVEIYNGASQDIIWQNAHPDFKKVAERMKESNKATSASKTWDWGRTAAGDEENAEVWEDELGSFNANLADNCSSRDKYMAIKGGRYAKE